MTSARFRYTHSGWPSTRRWLFHFLVLNALFALPMLLARSHGIAPSDATAVRAIYLGGTLLAMLGASVMLYRFTRTREISLDATRVVMPHYLWPAVQLERITAVHVDPRQPGVLLLGVHQQLPRYIQASALSPATTADALANRVRAAVAGIDADKARRLAHASQIATRTQGVPWACLCLATAWLAVHALAGRAGSRFDDLDLLASGGYLHSLALNGDVARILDASVLHAHVPHLLSNIAALLMLGVVLERLLGWRTLTATFVASALIATAGAGWMAPQTLHVGASGGLFGLIGVLVYLRVARPDQMPASIQALPVWLLLGVVALSIGAFVPGMDWMAHGLGLLSGLCIAVVVARAHAVDGEHVVMDHRTAARAGARERARAALPGVFAFLAIACIAIALADVSRRVLTMGHAFRLATLHALAASEPNLDALNSIAWRSVVLDGEFPSMARPLIDVLRTREPLSPEQRDTLAALHIVAGSAALAAHEQLTALLAAKQLPLRSQQAMAARLAAYVQLTDPARMRQHRPARSATDACTGVIRVTRMRGQPVSLQFNTERLAETFSSHTSSDAQSRWRSLATLDCALEARTWRIDDAAWQETQWLTRFR